jgi:hypothetical protein
MQRSTVKKVLFRKNFEFKTDPTFSWIMYFPRFFILHYKNYKFFVA